MIILNHPQGSQDWLQARAGVITASRYSDAISMVNGLTGQQQIYVDALLAGKTEGEAKSAAGYKNAPTAAVVERALAGEQVGEPSEAAKKYAWLIAFEVVSREPLDDTFVTYAMRRGRELEPHARRVYEARTGALVEEVSLILTEDSTFGYSADGFCDDDGLIEVKCPLACDKLGEVWAHPETAHAEYIEQINGGLWITGRKWCDLVVYCPWLSAVGKDLFVKRIYRDDDAITKLEDGLMRFKRMVDANLEILRAPARMSGAPKGPTAEALAFHKPPKVAAVAAALPEIIF